MYIAVFTHSTVSCIQLGHWEQSRTCTSSLFQMEKAVVSGVRQSNAPTEQK